MRFPRPGAQCESVTVNTGSRAFCDSPNARAMIAPQSAKKIYRAAGALVWAPQQRLRFEGADLRRAHEADVAADGPLLSVESVVFGRLAQGEERIDASLAESVKLDNARARAMATVVLIDRDAAARLEAWRAAAAGVGEGGRRKRLRRGSDSRLLSPAMRVWRGVEIP